MGDFRKFFFRGLAILLPSILTVALIWWAGQFLWEKIASPINAGVRAAVINVAPTLVGEESMPEWYTPSQEEVDAAFRARWPGPVEEGRVERFRELVRADLRREGLAEVWRKHWYLEAIGFLIAALLVYLAGLFVGNYIGRRVYATVERYAIRLPVIKQVYPNVKQVTDFLLGEGDAKTKLPSGRVVVVEYPRRGIWTVGLMTGDTLRAIEASAGVPSVTIFIPSSPTPFTGYTITVPADEVRELDLTLDEAIRFVVSGGVLVPPRQRVEEPRQIRPMATPAEMGPCPEDEGDGPAAEHAGDASGPDRRGEPA